MTYRRLEGQVAWISGAASGMGEATAKLFAQEGAAVALVDRNSEQCRQVADEINSKGDRSVAIACDVNQQEEVRNSIRKTVGEFGGLQIMVNNAGIVHVGMLHEVTEQDWDRVMGVNVKAMYLATKYGLEYLRKNNRSYIVMVGSISSLVGQAKTPIYTTSKHAVLGLARSVAIDYAADGIRCNCICPGITDTPMLREHLDSTPDPEATLASRLKRVPMGVALTPHDIAKSILYFSCEDSSGVTGTSLTIDCGYLTPAEWEHPGKTAFMEPS